MKRAQAKEYPRFSRHMMGDWVQVLAVMEPHYDDKERRKFERRVLSKVVVGLVVGIAHRQEGTYSPCIGEYENYNQARLKDVKVVRLVKVAVTWRGIPLEARLTDLRKASRVDLLWQGRV